MGIVANLLEKTTFIRRFGGCISNNGDKIANSFIYSMLSDRTVKGVVMDIINRVAGDLFIAVWCLVIAYLFLVGIDYVLIHDSWINIRPFEIGIVPVILMAILLIIVRPKEVRDDSVRDLQIDILTRQLNEIKENTESSADSVAGISDSLSSLDQHVSDVHYVLVREKKNDDFI